MSPYPSDQVEELKAFYGGVKAATEGNINYLLISGLTLPEGCNPKVVDALFCPDTNDAYLARLYFPQIINHPGKGQNWYIRDKHILGQNWSAVSWKIHPDNHRLLSKLLALLGAFRP